MDLLGPPGGRTTHSNRHFKRYNPGVKIYTGGGDGGETGLLGGARVPKDHARVEAYGAVDELGSVLGVARAAGVPEELDDLADRIQRQLFVLGADLATPPDGDLPAGRTLRLPDDAAEQLEPEIDACEAKLPPLQNFILAGGHEAGAALHHARTVCRRAERRVVTLARTEPVGAHVVRFLNRLSDLLFVMARLTNLQAGQPETQWKPR